MKRSSLDIGSNTVRLLVAESTGDTWKRVDYAHRVTRLSGGFDGSLQPKAMKRTVQAVAELAELAKRHEAVPIRAACTGVARRADNTESFLTAVRERASVKPVVISGEKEAALTAAGAVRATGLKDAPFVLFDIGGFSTEIIFVRNGAAAYVHSLEMGVVRLTEKMLPDELPSDRQVDELRQAIDAPIAKQAQAQKAYGESRYLVGTAGTVTSLAAMAQDLPAYDPKRVEGYVLPQTKLAQILQRTRSMTRAERIAAYPSLEKGREDLILAGILICQAMVERFCLSSLKVTEGGILEGLIEENRFGENGKSH